MSRSIRVLAALCVLLVPLASLQAREARVLVNSSHHGPITGLASQAVTGRAFSAGADGTVRVWDGEERRLQRVLAASPFEVQQIVAAPNLSLVATVSPEGRDGTRLGIWNWRTGREIYHFALEQEPLTVQFSPQGNFLVYTLPEFRSLRFVDLRTGRHTQPIQRGFGIVSFVTIASSEERIMTYSPAGGRIQYWDLASGDEIQRITTEHDLEEFTLLGGRRHGVGVDFDRLVVVDVLSGETRAEAELSEVVAIRRDPDTDYIGVVSRSDAGPGYEFSRWQYADGSLTRLEAPRGLAESFSDFTFHRGRVMVSHSDGRITYFFPFSGIDRVFAHPRTLPVESAIAAVHDLHLTLGSRLLSLSSDFLADSEVSITDARFLQYDSLQLPFESDIELTPLAPAEYVLWTGAEPDSELYLFDSREGSITATEIEVANRIRRVVAAADSRALYILDNVGAIRRYDLETGEDEHVYDAAGIQTFTRLDSGRLVIAGTTDPIFETPAVVINTETGETVPVAVDGFYILDMQYDDLGDTLYVLALKRVGPRNRIHTTLTAYHDLGLAGGTRLYSHPGEDLAAGITFDPERRRLYSTLGFQGVRVFDEFGSATTLERTVETPERIYAYRDRVFGINRSGSLSLWNASDGAHVLDFHAFIDGNWVVITPRGQFAMARPELAEEYLSLVPGRMQPTDLRAYDLSIPLELSENCPAACWYNR